MRLAYAQAMADMIRYSGFVAEDVDGNAIGYWFGPDGVPIEVAPLMYFDTTGNFSVLRGDGIAEAVLVIASHGNDRAFSDLRDYLNEHGLKITAQTIRDIQQPQCSPLPQVTYRRAPGQHAGLRYRLDRGRGWDIEQTITLARALKARGCTLGCPANTSWPQLSGAARPCGKSGN